MTNNNQRVGEYVVISPIKDEDKYVERTIESVVSQTLRPVEWIIVDDGSSDRTPDILKKYARQFPWIRTVTLAGGRKRQPGAAVIHAFNAGLKSLCASNFHFIVKLDCDTELPLNYFERLIAKFEDDPKLGIASGVYVEGSQATWNRIKMPSYHAAGASKVLRADCFDDIGGFISEKGWDTVDEIRAQVAGWHTRHFEDIAFFHLKNEGSGIGVLRTNMMHGQIFYLTGGGKAFLFAKVIDRAVFGKPVVVGGIALLWGYLRSWLKHETRLVSPEEAEHYRKVLNGRMRQQIVRLLPATSSYGK